MAHTDLIGFERSLVAEVRQALAAAYGLAARQVLLSATHTHSGPATVSLRWCGWMDPDYMAALPGYLLEVAGQAIASAEEVSLQVGEGRCTLGQDRRAPGPLSHADSALPVVGFRRADGTYLAYWRTTPCTTSRSPPRTATSQAMYPARRRGTPRRTFRGSRSACSRTVAAAMSIRRPKAQATP